MSRRKNLTWARALDTYETSLLARRASPLTIKTYLRDLALLQRLLKPLEPGQTRIEDLREAQVSLLTGEGTRSGRPAAPASTARASAAWRGLFGFLAAEGLLSENPAGRLDLPKQPKRVPGDVLSEEEIQRLLMTPSETTPTGVRDRALIELLYATGLRCGELRDLDLADLDRQERLILGKSGKGEKGRVVPLTRSAFHRVNAYLGGVRAELVSSGVAKSGQALAGKRGWRQADSLALFVSTRGNRISGVCLLKLLRKHAASAAIEKKVSPHTLRRTFATHLLQRGADIRSIQLLLGHASLDTTSLYLGLDREELRRTLLLKHPRERFDV